MLNIAQMRYIFLFGWVWAQVLTGSVVDGSTGEPLPGATVRIQGTSIGTLNSDRGEFQLPLGQQKPPFYLVVSYVGTTRPGSSYRL